jgi:hypothetical protein
VTTKREEEEEETNLTPRFLFSFTFFVVASCAQIMI